MTHRKAKPKSTTLLNVTAGARGLDISSGLVSTDYDKHLQGERKIKTYTEMRDNSAVIGAVLYAIKMLVRGVTWYVKPFDPNETADVDASIFVQRVFDTHEQILKKFVDQGLSMVVFGWSVHEILYSKDERGKILFYDLAVRPQRTFNKWITDPANDNQVVEFEQNTVDGGIRAVPLDKCVYLRIEDYEGSPEGRSLLRNAYRPWYFAKNIENHEAIRIERDAVGVPIARIPSDCLDNAAPPEKKAIKTAFEKVVANLRNDEQAGVVIPSDRDEAGNYLFDVSLLQSSGSTTINSNEPIQRYNTEILMTLLADFMKLGHEKVGSFALSSDKTNLFGQAVAGLLSIFSTALTEQLAQRLLDLNGVDGHCYVTHSDVEKTDLTQLATIIAQLSGVGMIFDDYETEAHVRTLLDLPEREDTALPGEEVEDAEETDTGAEDV